MMTARVATVLGLVLALGATCTAPRALAQDKVTIAEGLFREGRKLMEEGKYDVACDKLAESQRLDPSSGTLLNLAACHQKQGKIATAWAEYLAAGRLAQTQSRPERVEEAKARASELEPKVSYLKIVLAEKTNETTVKIDNVKLESSALGSQIPVDPGERSVEISAPGHKTLTMKVTVGAEHDVQTLTVPKLEAEAAAEPPPTGDTPPPPTGDQPPAADTGPKTAPSSSVLPYVVGGAGVVALGVGTAFAFMARSAYDDAESACPSHTGCSKDAIDQRDKAETRANIANIGVGIGIVGIGVGAVLLLTGSKEGASAEKATRSGFRSIRLEPIVSSNQAGLSLSGVTF